MGTADGTVARATANAVIGAADGKKVTGDTMTAVATAAVALSLLEVAAAIRELAAKAQP